MCRGVRAGGRGAARWSAKLRRWAPRARLGLRGRPRCEGPVRCRSRLDRCTTPVSRGTGTRRPAMRIDQLFHGVSSRRSAKAARASCGSSQCSWSTSRPPSSSAKPWDQAGHRGRVARRRPGLISDHGRLAAQRSPTPGTFRLLGRSEPGTVRPPFGPMSAPSVHPLLHRGRPPRPAPHLPPPARHAARLPGAGAARIPSWLIALATTAPASSGTRASPQDVRKLCLEQQAVYAPRGSPASS